MTSTGIALILKINVITNIRVLKTGMYAGRGHSISLPQPMNIAIQSVQEALEDLCYGFPNGGIDSPNDLCQEFYTGADHRQMPLREIFSICSKSILS